MVTSNEKLYAFVLGREKELALAELKAVIERFGFYFSASASPKRDGDITKITGNIVFAKMQEEDNLYNALNTLGGTIKVFEIEEHGKISGSVIASLMKRHKDANLKFNFGISDYSGHYSKEELYKLGLVVKKQLKPKYKTRLVVQRDSIELSSIMSLKNDLITRGIEVGFFDGFIGRLIYLNNPEEWSKRDYGKPAQDRFSGMLPPKLARMMVNLTVGKDTEVVFDPFCGSGNVLMEAMVLKYNVIGSDISEKAVGDTNKNLEWVKTEYDLATCFNVFQADATNYDFERLAINGKLSVIVTEPFLGNPKKFIPSFVEVDKEYSKLKELFIGFFKNIVKQKLNYSKICIAFPLIEMRDGNQYSLYARCVDELDKLGYTQACKSFVYGRDYQVVKREIVLLNLKFKI